MIKHPFCKAVVALCLATSAWSAQAAWPNDKPITMIVPFAAGGSTDVSARLLASKLGDSLKQRVIVENMTGAGSNIGSAYVARAKPDGYTLLFSTNTIATNVSLYKSPGYSLSKDLAPVSEFAQIPNVLVVNNNFPAKTLQEFVDYVRQKKGPVNYGSAGSGSASHLSGALFNSMAHGDMMHIPYQGGAPANVDLVGGQIQAVFAPMVEILSLIEAGKLRALAVTTEGRSPRLPNLPAVDEALPGFNITLWNGVMVPAGTPSAVVNKLAAAIQAVTAEADVRKTLLSQGSIPVGSSPDAFKTLMGKEIQNQARLVKISGAKVQ